jgi:CRP/FNR family transcriptional regulator
MYIIISGKVKVVQTSVKGKERIFAIHRRGDFFGEMSLLDGKTEPATVIAMEKTEVGLLSKKDFDHFLLHNDRVLYQIVRLLCTRLRDVWLMLKVMSFADAEQKVIAVLQQMSTLYGIRDQRGIVIHLRLTHKDIAGLAAISRETVTNIMNKLIKEKVIEILTNKAILIKPSINDKLEFL